MCLVRSDPVLSPLHDCMRSHLWESSRPSRWHPQHMWHDLPQHGYTRGTKSPCKQQAGSSDVGVPPGQGSRMRCPSLHGSADAAHNCQAFSFIRPRSDTYRGAEPAAIATDSLQCGRTCIHTQTYTQTMSHLEPFLKGVRITRAEI